MIRRQSSVTFGHRGLADVIANETLGASSGGESGERFAGVNLTWWRDWLDPRGAADVGPAVIAVSRDRIVELVNWSGVERDAKAQSAAQSFLFPFRRSDKISEFECELAGEIDIGKDKIKSIAPRILGDDLCTKLFAQLRDRSQKMLNESRHFVLG